LIVLIKISRSRTDDYCNVPNLSVASLSPIKITPKIETEPIIIHFEELKVEICSPIPPELQLDSPDVSPSKPTLQDSPVSNQKPNADNKILGTYESTMIVFAAFSLLILVDMVINSIICNQRSNPEVDYPLFTVLYMLGIPPAL
jgi:hypothetical protein